MSHERTLVSATVHRDLPQTAACQHIDPLRHEDWARVRPRAPMPVKEGPRQGISKLSTLNRLRAFLFILKATLGL